MRTRLLWLLCSIGLTCVYGQKPSLQLLGSQYATSIRGLSVVDKDCFWVSGSNGTVGKSTNGGKTIEWQIIPGYEKRDFRDIEALNDSTMVVMAVAEPAIMLKTHNNGKHWYQVFEDTTKGMFLDAFHFKGNTGIVIGDPLGNKAYLAVTYDAGEHWQRLIATDTLLSGESFFAASGANIVLTQTGKHLDYCYISGGKASRFLHTSHPSQTIPLQQGSSTTGANAIAKWGKHIVIVGGDFDNKQLSDGTCVISNNGGRSFTAAQQPPLGYKSSVCFVTKNLLVACGTSGVDWSNNGGKTWQNITTAQFHVVQKTPNSRVVYLAGNKGNTAKLIF